MLNSVVLIGRTATEVDLRFTQGGHAVAGFRLAVDRPFKNQQGETETDFFSVVAWRKLAETLAHYMGKGRLVAVEGRLQTSSWEKDGERRTSVEIVADNVRFLDWPKDGQAEGRGASAQGQGQGGSWDGHQEDGVPF